MRQHTKPNGIDVLILGGGYGTRLLKNTLAKDYIPKGLVDIVGKPAVERALEAFPNPFINKIILETNNEGEKHYSNWISNYSKGKNIELFVEPISTPDVCLGVLQTISYVHEKSPFTKPVLIIAPDNIFLETQEHIFDNGRDFPVTMLAYNVRSYEDARKYGVLTLENSKVTHCEEKPKKPLSTKVRTACELWKPKIFNMLNDWIKIGDTYKAGNFIQYVIQSGIDVRAFGVKGEWKDIGNKYDLEETRRLWE